MMTITASAHQQSLSTTFYIFCRGFSRQKVARRDRKGYDYANLLYRRIAQTGDAGRSRNRGRT